MPPIPTALFLVCVENLCRCLDHELIYLFFIFPFQSIISFILRSMSFFFFLSYFFCSQCPVECLDSCKSSTNIWWRNEWTRAWGLKQKKLSFWCVDMWLMNEPFWVKYFFHYSDSFLYSWLDWDWLWCQMVNHLVCQKYKIDCHSVCFPPCIDMGGIYEKS